MSKVKNIPQSPEKAKSLTTSLVLAKQITNTKAEVISPANAITAQSNKPLNNKPVIPAKAKLTGDQKVKKGWNEDTRQTTDYKPVDKFVKDQNFDERLHYAHREYGENDD